MESVIRSALNLMKSYLENRKQFVQFDECISEMKAIPRKQLGTKRYLLDSDLSGPVVPTSSRHVITHGLTKGNSIGVEIGTV